MYVCMWGASCGMPVRVLVSATAQPTSESGVKTIAGCPRTPCSVLTGDGRAALVVQRWGPKDRGKACSDVIPSF